MIKLSSVTKSFGAIDVLTGVDLELHRGDSMVLIGGSGSGKSLLLKTMIGLMRPDTGTVQVYGKDVRRMRSAERRAFDDRFGMLFQYGGLFDGMTVWRNIAFKQLQTGQMNERQYSCRIWRKPPSTLALCRRCRCQNIRPTCWRA